MLSSILAKSQVDPRILGGQALSRRVKFAQGPRR